MRIIVVGVCASGKTTLVTQLKDWGFDAHNVAQEHSGIKTLWKRKEPDVVIMLDATLDSIRKRRNVPWGEERLIVQRERLQNVRQHADLFLPTDSLTKEEVAQKVVAFVRG